MSLTELIKKKTNNKADLLDKTAAVDDWKETVPEGYDFDAVYDGPKQECPRCKKMILEDQLASHKDSHSSEIFETLFLGGERNAKNLEELTTRTNISEILCVSGESTNQHPDKFVYHNYIFKDSADENIVDKLDEITDIIEEARKNNKNVLVHCVQGISRSASCVIAYCMKYKGWSLKESYDYVKSKRRIISPNTGFVEQLGEYEKRIFGVETPTLTISDVYADGGAILQVG